MYKEMFETLIKEYPDFFDEYIKFYMERFIYSNTEIEGIRSQEERKRFVSEIIEAIELIYKNSTLINISDIIAVGNKINTTKGIAGFRKINVLAGTEATFSPVAPSQIYASIYSLLDNYYNVWNELDPFLREAMFHIIFMRIHPFEDGNKRTSKIILTSNLLKAYCAPVVITEEDTKLYYSFINNSDYEGLAVFLRQRSKIEMETLVSLFKMKYNIPMDKTPEIFFDCNNPKR